MCFCGSSYIVQTKRSLINRLKEHSHSDKSEVCRHLTDNPDHKMGFAKTDIFSSAGNSARLLLLEMGCKLPTSTWCILEGDLNRQANGNLQSQSVAFPGGKRIDPRPRGLRNTSRWNGGYKTSFSGRDTNTSLYRRPTT